MRYLQATYQYDFLSIHFSYIKQITNLQLAYIKGDTLFLTQAGKLLADKIAADLFVV
jgi:oxygen-independent coproporphyrinogen-3 oxidase